MDAMVSKVCIINFCRTFVLKMWFAGNLQLATNMKDSYKSNKEMQIVCLHLKSCYSIFLITCKLTRHPPLNSCICNRKSQDCKKHSMKSVDDHVPPKYYLVQVHLYVFHFFQSSVRTHILGCPPYFFWTTITKTHVKIINPLCLEYSSTWIFKSYGMSYGCEHHND